MARDGEIDRRLINWARWVSGGGGKGARLGYAGTSFMQGLVGRGHRDYETAIPVLDCEAEETQRGVLALPVELQDVVGQVYLGEGNISKRLAALDISRTTMRARLYEAHARLREWFAMLDAGRRRERERVEAAQRAAMRGFYT